MDEKSIKEQQIMDRAYEISKEVNEICSNKNKKEEKEEEQER